MREHSIDYSPSVRELIIAELSSLLVRQEHAAEVLASVEKRIAVVEAVLRGKGGKDA